MAKRRSTAKRKSGVRDLKARPRKAGRVRGGLGTRAGGEVISADFRAPRPGASAAP